MAQFKSSTVFGNLSVTGKINTSSGLQVTKLEAPTSAGSTTLGVGSNGQVLKSDGTNIYWGNDKEGSGEISINPATATDLGGIKVGFTTSGKNYKLQLDSNYHAYVNVPWIDTDATQSTHGLMSASDKKKLDGIADSADAVSFSPSATSGTKIGSITINGTSTDIYSGTHKVNQSVSSYDGWRKIMLSGQYATDKTFAVETTDDVLYASAALRCHPRTGGIDSAGTINAVTLSENGTTLSNKYQAKGLVNVTDTTPTSATKYFPIYTQGQSGDLAARANKDLYYYDSGTWSSFNIGGNANMGILTLHYGNSSTDYMADIKPEKVFTANRSILIPDKSGTLALTSDLNKVEHLSLSGPTSTSPMLYFSNSRITYTIGNVNAGAAAYELATKTDASKVTQAYSTTNAMHPLLMTSVSGSSSTSSRGTTTTILTNLLYANPSTGGLTCGGLHSSKSISTDSNISADGDIGAEGCLRTTKYLKVWDDEDDYTGIDNFDGDDVDTNYYAKGIIIGGSYKLAFPAKSGTLATLEDLEALGFKESGFTLTTSIAAGLIVENKLKKFGKLVVASFSFVGGTGTNYPTFNQAAIRDMIAGLQVPEGFRPPNIYSITIWTNGSRTGTMTVNKNGTCQIGAYPSDTGSCYQIGVTNTAWEVA